MNLAPWEPESELISWESKRTGESRFFVAHDGNSMIQVETGRGPEVDAELARRIVACLRHCRGYSTGAIEESATAKELAEERDLLRRLVARKDQALAILGDIRNCATMTPPVPDPIDFANQEKAITIEDLREKP